MWIADVSAIDYPLGSADGEFFPQYFAVGSRHGHRGAVEAHASHFDRYGALAFPIDTCTHDAAGYADAEALRLDETTVPQMPSEDAQAVAAHFRFASVRVEYAHRRHHPFFRRNGRWVHGAPQDAISAHTPVPVTDIADRAFTGRCRIAARLQHQVIVAQSVVFEEIHHR